MKKQKEITPADKLTKAFKKYRALAIEILHSNAFTEDAEIEIEALLDNLYEDLIDLADENNPDDFESIIPKLKKLKTDDELIDENVNQLFSLIDESDIINYLEDKNYLFLKIDSFDKREKLKEFLKQEIFPFYNEQRTIATNIF